MLYGCKTYLKFSLTKTMLGSYCLDNREYCHQTRLMISTVRDLEMDAWTTKGYMHERNLIFPQHPKTRLSDRRSMTGQDPRARRLIDGLEVQSNRDSVT